MGQATEFNPYRVWLQVRPETEQPNHYELLGLDDFENDREVIRSAADKQMLYLRTLSNGPHAEVSERILNEVTGAKICLLDDSQREQYDRELRPIASHEEPIAAPAPSASRAKSSGVGWPQLVLVLLAGCVAGAGGSWILVDRARASGNATLKLSNQRLSDEPTKAAASPVMVEVESTSHGDPALLEIHKRFAGKIEQFDPASGSITLSYDFSDPSQLEDWTSTNWKGFAPEGTWSIVEGKLRLENTDSLVLLRFGLTEARVSAELSVLEGPSQNVHLVTAAHKVGILQRFFAFAVDAESQSSRLRPVTAIGNWLNSARADDSRAPVLDPAADGSMTLTHRGSQLIGETHQAFTVATPASHDWSGQVGVWAEGTIVEIDNVRVEGNLIQRKQQLDERALETPQTAPYVLVEGLHLPLVPDQTFEFPIEIPQLPNGTGQLVVYINNAGDDRRNSDGGMYTILRNFVNDVEVARWFDVGSPIRQHAVVSGSKWVIEFEDRDTPMNVRNPGNWAWVTISVVPD